MTKLNKELSITCSFFNCIESKEMGGVSGPSKQSLRLSTGPHRSVHTFKKDSIFDRNFRK